MAKINTVGMCTIAIHTHMYMYANTHMYTALHTHVQYPPQTCELTRPTPHKAELTLSGKSTYLWLSLEGKMLTPKVSRDCRGRKDRRETRSGHQL